MNVEAWNLSLNFNPSSLPSSSLYPRKDDASGKYLTSEDFAIMRTHG
jgi:hypothetical protein